MAKNESYFRKMTSLPTIDQNRVAGMSSRASNHPPSPSKGNRRTTTGCTQVLQPTQRENYCAHEVSQRRQTRFMTQREQELLMEERIRQQQPILNKIDTSYYRNTYMHNICVGMLKEGFHKSFNELFTLSTDRKMKRLEAGPDSIMWEDIPLEEQYEKLDEICNYMTKAESAERLGKWDDVYACRHILAQYFLKSGDLWLSDHFFETSLQTSLNIKLDGRRREAEAHCHMSLACERRGELEASCQHMQGFYHLTLGRLWADDDDINLHHLACRHLCRIYAALAKQSSDTNEKRTLLHKAYDMSKEGEDSLQEAEAAFKLGCAYELAHDSETAIEFVNKCLTIASDHKDNVLVGQACEALSKSHRTLGAVTKSIEYLELFAATSKTSGRKAELIDACNCLGITYNTLGKYEESIRHFSDSYNVVQEVLEEEKASVSNDSNMPESTNRPEVEECAVHLGIACGNSLLNAFAGNMEIPMRVMMERIVCWKDERINEFGQPLPVSKVHTPPPTPEQIPDPTEPFLHAEEDMIYVRQVEGESPA